MIIIKVFINLMKACGKKIRNWKRESFEKALPKTSTCFHAKNFCAPITAKFKFTAKATLATLNLFWNHTPSKNLIYFVPREYFPRKQTLNSSNFSKISPQFFLLLKLNCECSCQLKSHYRFIYHAISFDERRN